MNVRTARDLGLLLRRARERRQWSQAELAHAIGVSRHWVLAVEKGKPSAEVGLVLSALAALDLSIDVSGAAAPTPDTAPSEHASREGGQRSPPYRPATGTDDVREILARSTGSSNILAGFAGGPLSMPVRDRDGGEA
jgi:y4mF family transcriptional regulator